MGLTGEKVKDLIRYWLLLTVNLLTLFFFLFIQHKALP